mgnify:CR=1 FL=1
MEIYRNIRSLTKKVQEIKRKGLKIGLVPTMGFLHEGHMSLIRRAAKDTDCVIVSIFVNPAQFGPKEDFKKYPRDMKKDLELCEKEAVDIIFAPEAGEVYPEGFATYVKVERITDALCGASRPGHFRGVATVVAKLFNITMPDIAYFGQKDSQQAVIIKRMTEDLNMPVKIKVEPVVREKDGLAMSSRNVYLNPEERKQALSLYRSLELARCMFDKGERSASKIINRMKREIQKNPDAKIDYISIVNADNLAGLERIKEKALIAIAVLIGKTRLIDNIILK